MAAVLQSAMNVLQIQHRLAKSSWVVTKVVETLCSLLRTYCGIRQAITIGSAASENTKARGYCASHCSSQCKCAAELVIIEL